MTERQDSVSINKRKSGQSTLLKLSVTTALAASACLWLVGSVSVPIAAASGLLWLIGGTVAFKQAARVGRLEATRPDSEDGASVSPSILSQMKAMAISAVIVLFILWTATVDAALFLAALTTGFMALLIGVLSAFVLGRAEIEARRAMP